MSGSFKNVRGINLIISASLVWLLLAVILSGPAFAQSISLSSTLAKEGDDYATRVIGQPWDMNVSPYPDFTTVFLNVNRPSFSVANGLCTYRHPYPSFRQPLVQE